MPQEPAVREDEVASPGLLQRLQEVLRVALDRELEIAILKSVRNTLVKCGHQIVHRPNFHNPLDLSSRYEAQLYGGNDSKKAIPTVNQPK